MSKTFNRIAVIGAVLIVLPCFASAADDQPPTADQVAATVGTAMPDDVRGRMEDVTATDGQGFSVPTEVYAGGISLDMDGEQMDFDLYAYMRDGKACGFELDYYPPNDMDFEDLTFEEQQAAFNKIYGNIADNYAGDSGGKTEYYDSSGGLYDYTDGNHITWSLAWAAGHELTLSFDSSDFFDEHSAQVMARQLGELAEDIDKAGEES